MINYCRYIVKIIAIFLLMLLILFDFDDNAKKRQFNASYEDTYEFYPIINQFSYALNEDIDLSFMLKADSNVKTIEYGEDGFVVTKESYYKDNIYLKINYDGKTSKPSIVLKVIFDNGRKISSKLYGFVENDKVYINKNSFDAARDIYLSEALENCTIDEREYERIINEDNINSIKRNNLGRKNIKNTRSETGGWVDGTIRWKDDWGNYHPLQYTKVSIYDVDPLLDEFLGSAYTDGNGYFFFYFDSNIDGPLDSSGRDILVKVKPEGINSIVKTGTNCDYIILSDLFNDVVSGETTDAGFDIDDMMTDINRAFQISQAIITASRFAGAMNGANLSGVNVRYPHNDDEETCFYRQLNETIYIIGNNIDDNYYKEDLILRSYASWDVVMHEYGHFVQDMLDIEDSPGGTHWSNHNMYDHYLSHYSGIPNPECNNKCAHPSVSNAKEYAIKTAYSEAWASVFSGIAQKYYVDLEILDSNIKTVGDALYESYNNAYINYETVPYTSEATEGAIIGILWDIFDSNNDGYDALSYGYTGWWNLTTICYPTYFSEVATNFYSINNSLYDYMDFNSLLEHFGMAPTDIDISSSAVSHVAPTFTWTANGTSSSLQNNYFNIIVYDSSYNIIVSDYSYSTSASLTLNDWASVINASGDTFYVSVGGSQTSSPTTGFYYSSLYAFDKPEVETTISSGSVKVTGYYSWTPSILTISSSYGGYSTTSIDDAAFYGCNFLTRIVIPNSVTSVGSSAFESCVFLSSVSMSSSLTAINDDVFNGCISLSTISIPSSVTSIGDGAFKNCSSLTNAYMSGSTLNSIGDESFKGCCSLSYITIPNNVTSIGESAFEGCSSLTSVSLPSSLNDIEDYTFKNCSSLSSISFPNNISTIGDYAFMGCTSLEEVDIPSSVSSIGSFAFYGCTYLEDVSINKETIPLTSLGVSAFYSCASSLVIEVPHNRIADYINSSGWSYYQLIIEPDDSFYSYDIYNNANTTIPGYLFSGCNVLYELDIINQDTYEISSTGASNTVIKLYDSSFSLIDSSYSTITEALSNNSNYYLSVEFTNSSSSGTISTLIKKYVPHVHSYQYTWNSYTHHLKSCSCGDSSLEVHAVASGSFPPGQQYAPCLICNGMASIGLVGPDSINQYPSTVNGSYILPNGVVVLVAADINDYLNGTLIFNYPNVNSINNNLPYLKKEEYLTK